MQDIETLIPVYINLTKAPIDLKPNESPFLKNWSRISGRNKTGKQGGNLGPGKKLSSNWQLIPVELPEGINKTVFEYEHVFLNEAYVGIWNSLGQHTIYVLYGATMTHDIVYQGPDLVFSIDPANFIKAHRAYIRVIYDVDANNQRHVHEKLLFFTDGNNWQYQISIMASIATQSFNASRFPYYQVYAPHNDTAEFIQYPSRPPMFAPVVTAIARTTADQSLQNLMLNKSTQFAYRYIFTDGRQTTLSPYSNPYYVVKTSCTSSRLLPRSVDLELYAGSAHVEAVQLFVRTGTGDWMLYDTLYRFDTVGPNAPAVIGDAYWNRVNPWSQFNYNPTTNTIHYTYAADLQATIFPVEDAIAFQNDVPIKSVALIPAGDALLWANNLYNYDNLPKEELNKFSFTVDQDSDQPAIKNSKIVIYAIIGRNASVNQVVYTNGTDMQVRFGGLSILNNAFSPGINTIDIDVSDNDAFGLFLHNGNFVAYLAGTPYTATAVQYKSDSSGVLTKVGTLDRTNNDHLALIADTFKAGGLFVQRFEFNVPAGKYVARIAYHDIDLSLDYAATSTFVMGRISHKNIYDAGFNFIPNRFNSDPSNAADYTKEQEIDASAGDVDLWNQGNDCLYIFVPYVYKTGSGLFDLGGAHWRFIEGYLKEDTINNIPIEQMYYFPVQGHTDNMRSAFFTDHNGYFFGYMADGDANNSEIAFYGFYNCQQYHYLFSTSVNASNAGRSDYYPNQDISEVDKLGPIPPQNRISIKGQVVDCTTGQGIPSIGITLTQTKTYFTDSDGNFEIFAHEAPRNYRRERIYFNFGGECLFSTCSGGILGLIPVDTQAIVCANGVERTFPAITLSLKAVNQFSNGPKEGGKYGIGIAAIDYAGRATFLQEIQYIDIPSFLQTGNFAPSKISWKITSALSMPSFVKYFTFFRTAERNALSYLQWVGDSILFLDSKGNSVPDGNGAIRAQIIIQSLLDFNIKNNFNTNVNYQFTPGDFVRIYDDGNGNLFNPANNAGFMDYAILGTDYNQTVEGYNQGNVATTSVTKIIDPQGNVTNESTVTTPTPNQSAAGVSLIVEYDERLLQLKDMTGFWIQITRPKDIVDIDGYTEIIGTIPVVNGVPSQLSGTLNTFDTFMQTRFIRIPTALGKSLGHPFCSMNITDYWGAGVNNTGRQLVKNVYAKQLWYEDDVIQSDDLISNGTVNGLGRVRDKNRKNFKGQTFGGIVGGHAERNRIVFVCTNDWFMCDYQMNYLKVTSQGLIQADLDQNLSEPAPKEGNNYGCAYEDTATIIFDKIGSTWLDRYNNTLVERPVGSRVAYSVADDDMAPYFINKLSYLTKFNNSLSAEDFLINLIEIIGGRDPMTGQYNLTFRPRRGLKTHPQYFVNDEREQFDDMQETLVYNPDEKKWVHYAGYTPEFYGTLGNAQTGEELITFVNGLPYFHNSVGKFGSNVFYGIETNTVVEIPLNVDKEKVKIFQSFVASCVNIKWFIDRVTTDDDRFFSYVPLSWVKRKERTFYGPFLRNMSSYPNPFNRVVSQLMDGGRVFGKFSLIRLVADPNKKPEYTELNNVEYRITGSEKSEK